MRILKLHFENAASKLQAVVTALVSEESYVFMSRTRLSCNLGYSIIVSRYSGNRTYLLMLCVIAPTAGLIVAYDLKLLQMYLLCPLHHTALFSAL